MNVWSGDGLDAQLTEGGACEESCKPLFILLVTEIEAAALMTEVEVIDGEHSQTQAHLRPGRIEIDVEGFFCNAEFGDADGQDPVLVPDEERQGCLHRGALQGSDGSQAIICDQMAAGRVDDRFQRCQLGQYTRC